MSPLALSTSSTSHLDILFAKIEEELNSKQHVTFQNYHFSDGKLTLTRDLKKHILFKLELKGGILK